MPLFEGSVEGADGNIKELIGIPVHLQRYALRGVDTMYGPGTAIDLYIASPDGEKMYTGFGAGIKRQLQDSTPDEFPVWVKIENKDLRGGKTTLILVPSSAEEVSDFQPQEEDLPF